MRAKKQNKTVLEASELTNFITPDSIEASNSFVEDKEIELASQPCGAWCFILGAAVGAFCMKDENHEGEPHETRIQVFAEPVSDFTITWTLG